MQLSSPERHWNELQFLSWREFTQMAPSIIQLEISRIGSIIDAPATHIDMRNVLVKSRFELRKFQECLQRAELPPLGDSCLAHLRTSILSLSIQDQIPDRKAAATLKYVCDRLISLLRRTDLIFRVE
jgi:hypothetical protein